MSSFKRRIYLINPRFQLKFSLISCVSMALASIFYPLIIYDLITDHLPNVTSEMKLAIILVITLWHLGITGIVFVVSIFFSHKIAGPIFKTCKFLKIVATGKFPGKLFFRKGDYFPELAEDYNNALTSMQETYLRDFTCIDEITGYLAKVIPELPEDKRPAMEEIKNKLTEIQARFEGT